MSILAFANKKDETYFFKSSFVFVTILIGSNVYNVFVFGSYLTTSYVEGKSDIDIAIYSEDFNLYKRISLYLETYFRNKGVASDIFYIDVSMQAPIYCAPLRSKVQFTDYYPKKLEEFYQGCQKKLEENRARVVG